MSARVASIVDRLCALGDADIAAHSQRYFQTGAGQYGEGDRFLGIRLPVIRRCVRQHRDLPLADALELLNSPYHEARMLALLILVARYGAATADIERQAIYRSYLAHTESINNWDLVDCSARQIVGAYLFTRNRKPINRLARSRSLWERRIAVMATFRFIDQGDFGDSLALAERLLHDPEDLIHKAVGWMLREVGNRDPSVEETFLNAHYRDMPRTMLRYAIEKLPEDDRQAYLNGVK